MTGPEPEQEFGKYHLVRRLAVGGMAEIFLAEHRAEAGFVRPVVIKRVLPNLSENPEFITMFLDEARLLARLIHPNVVHVYDFGRIDDTYFLALEYVRGGNLRELFGRLKGAPLPIGHALYLAGQCLAGLDHAHRARASDGTPLRLVHRDISPSNILLSIDGAAKLADFGIARSTLQQVHTAAFVIKGKLSYMSPEQVTGRPLDARSDLFSTGVLLWEMITGRRLFARDSPGEIQHAICIEPLPDARDYRHDIPDPVLALLDRALMKERDRRFPTAAAMQAAIDECLMACRLVVGAQQLGSFVRQCFPEMLEDGGRADDEPAAARLEGGGTGTSGTAVIDEPSAVGPREERTASLVAPPERRQDTATTPIVVRRPRPPEEAARPPDEAAPTLVRPAPPPRTGITAALRRPARAALAAVRRRGLLQPMPVAAAAGVCAVLALGVWTLLPAAAPATHAHAGGAATRASASGRDAATGAPAAAPAPAPASVSVSVSVKAAAAAREAGPAAAARAALAGDAGAAATRPDRGDGAGGPRATGREPAARPVEHGLLSVQARPSAVVFLDGRKIGETPIYRRRTPAGGHALELRSPGRATFKRRIHVPAHGEFQKTFELAPAP